MFDTEKFITEIEGRSYIWNIKNFYYQSKEKIMIEEIYVKLCVMIGIRWM